MSFIVDAIGTIGALLFAGSCGPLAWKTAKAGHSLGLPRSTAWTFLAATGLFTLYLALKVGIIQGSTIISFSETVAYVVIVWYEHFPRRKPITFGMFDGNSDVCTREPYHEGPCNGLPAPECLVWHEGLGKAIPFCQHGSMDAALLYKKISD